MHLVKSPVAGWVACALIGAIVIYGLLKPWGIGLDFANFYDAGSKAALGEFTGLYDSHALIGGKPPLSNMAFFSAPITSYLYAPMAMLPPHAALVLFKLVGTASMVVGLVLLYRQSAETATMGDAGLFGLFAVAAFLFQPFWTIYRVGGQTTPIVFLLLVLAHGLFLRARGTAAALVLAAAVLVKPAFAPLAVLIFVMADNRFRVTAVAVGVVVGTLSLAIFGWPLHADFLDRIAAESSSALAPWKNSSPFTWIGAIFTPPGDYLIAADVPPFLAHGMLALRVATVLALLWTLRWHLARPLAPTARRHAIYVTGLLLIVVLSPVIWAHYLTILFIPVAFLIAGRDALGRGVQIALGIAVAMSLFQNLIFSRQMEDLTGFDQLWEIVAIAAIRSAPALLIVCVWLFGRQSIARFLARAQWAEAPASSALQPTKDTAR
jgi:Glycosyltransferase family 87